MKLARLDPLASAPEIDREPELVTQKVQDENSRLRATSESTTQNKTTPEQGSPSKQDMLGAFTRLSERIKAKATKKKVGEKGSFLYKALKAYTALDDMEVCLLQKGSSLSRNK